jgi:quercetin dioxygenase-like cupin family protein
MSSLSTDRRFIVSGGTKRKFDIVELKAKTEQLPDLASLVLSVNNGVIEYDAAEGTILGFPLFHTPKVAVQRHFLSSGTVFGNHTHEQREWLLVYDGELKVQVEDKEERLSVAECVFVDAAQEHSLEAIRDTWLICVSIPAAEGYPYTRR